MPDYIFRNPASAKAPKINICNKILKQHQVRSVLNAVQIIDKQYYINNRDSEAHSAGKR